MTNFEAVLSAANQLPVTDRLRLIDELAASIPDDAPPSLSKEWLVEIDRRSAQLDSGEVTPEPWTQVRKRLFTRLGIQGEDRLPS